VAIARVGTFARRREFDELLEVEAALLAPRIHARKSSWQIGFGEMSFALTGSQRIVLKRVLNHSHVDRFEPREGALTIVSFTEKWSESCHV
jgi:hypothetical protein